MWEGNLWPPPQLTFHCGWSVIIAHLGVAPFLVHWKCAQPFPSVVIIRGGVCKCLCVCPSFLWSDRPERENLVCFNWYTTKPKVVVQFSCSQAEEVNKETDLRKESLRLLNSSAGKCATDYWTLMCGAKPLIHHQQTMFVSTQLLIFAFHVNICDLFQWT